MTEVTIRTDAYGFGLIIPEKTGIILEHQCDGALCNQIQQEGTFIPLKERYFESYLNELGDREYCYNEERLPFKFKVVAEDFSNLKGKEVDRKLWETVFQEAWEWIIFLGWKDKTDFSAKEWDKLIGKRLLLVYPNSD